jgi:hypothetical protein
LFFFSVITNLTEASWGDTRTVCNDGPVVLGPFDSADEREAFIKGERISEVGRLWSVLCDEEE